MKPELVLRRASYERNKVGLVGGWVQNPETEYLRLT